MLSIISTDPLFTLSSSYIFFEFSSIKSISPIQFMLLIKNVHAFFTKHVGFFRQTPWIHGRKIHVNPLNFFSNPEWVNHHLYFPPPSLPHVCGKVLGNSSWISQDFQWIWVDMWFVDLHFLSFISESQPSLSSSTSSVLFSFGKLAKGCSIDAINSDAHHRPTGRSPGTSKLQ